MGRLGLEADLVGVTVTVMLVVIIAVGGCFLRWYTAPLYVLPSSGATDMWVEPG